MAQHKSFSMCQVMIMVLLSCLIHRAVMNTNQIVFLNALVEYGSL